MSDLKNLIQQKFNNEPFGGNGSLKALSQKGIELFNEQGIPTVKHEEWKYTRISGVLGKEFSYAVDATAVTTTDVDAVRLPGHEMANELVFVNGIYHAELSNIRSSAEELVILPLSEAVKGDYKSIIDNNLGHSAKYHTDGINAMNNAFAYQGLFIAVKKNKAVEHPLYCYYINDARTAGVLSQPRTLIHVGVNAEVFLVEEEITLGTSDSFINRVSEIVVEENANVHIYKIQNEDSHSSCVKTTHVRQLGVSKVNSVTLTLNGGMIRNNLNFILEAPGCESNMYGLYCVKGETHVDNHTIVDNQMPHSLSNELYKGIIDENATAVFNGKIFVRQDAQKTNAYQSNKNVLLSDAATVNTKPQLEIFADDVKCSHGCTVGRLDEEALFYLKARGIGDKEAKALLLHAFAGEILEKIELEPIREYADQIISERLGFEI
ncbi:Fe-S cluster assembly protein SufD [Lacibacter sp. MH-610]|uniref:Fe-S cluster assembly protein SufD n=1 Tax=Lacibacter sp. MH-610 TaxID=3020883 RepID=UPI0038923B57